MSFFYDLNKKLDSIRATPEVTHKQLNERDMKKTGKLEEEGFPRIQAAIQKYTQTGVNKLAKLGREGASKAKMDATRKEFNQYDNKEVDEGLGDMARAAGGAIVDRLTGAPTKAQLAARAARRADNVHGAEGKARRTDYLDQMASRDKALGYDESMYEADVTEGPMDTVKKVGKKVAGGINRLVGHGSDEEMRKDLQRKSGAPVTGKKPEQKTTEAAKYRDPKYKDKLYTQEPPDYTYGPDYDDAYDNPKPDDYAGRKRKIGGGEFPSTDPLERGQGIGRSGIKNNILDRGPRKGLPSRDQISSLKGSIKAARGTHAQPNLPEAGAPMTAKQKSFAKLAPPADKITFADKIAGAKKEVDEMLGDVAAEAMRNALSPKQKKIDMNKNGKLDANDFAMLRKGAKPDMSEDQPTHFEVHYKDNQKGRTAKTQVKGSDAKQAKAAWNDWNSSNTPGRFTFVAVKPVATEMDEENAFTAHKRPSPVQPKVGSTERGHKHDIKHTATGRMVTRRVDDQGISVGADDDSDTQAGPRGRGRPKGTTAAIGARGPSGKSKLMTKESEVSTGNLKQMHQLVIGLKSYVQDPDGQALLKELMSLIKHYATQSPVDEEKTSTRDDHAERAGKKVTKDIEYDEKKKDGIHGKKRGAEDAKAEKAGKKVAKDIEHDEKKKDKEVDESTTSGSVATSTATKGSKGSMVGKGIYDSMNRELENMIAESMSINMSDSTEGNKSLTVTATDEDAMKLAMMLKSAGIGGQGGDMHSHSEQPCPTCGMSNCGCGDVQEAVDENSPDYPTNTEQANNNFGYAGGLDGPKSTGQSTVPVLASQDDRQHSYAAEEEDAIKRMMEMAGLAEAAKPDFLDLDKDGNKKESMKDAADNKEEDTVEESIRRMMEIAGVKKKPMDEEKTDEGNKFAFNVLKAKEAGKKEADLDGDGDMEKVRESIFALNNQWRAYKG